MIQFLILLLQDVHFNNINYLISVDYPSAVVYNDCMWIFGGKKYSNNIIFQDFIMVIHIIRPIIMIHFALILVCDLSNKLI
jgi:hypothetical protein